jgi:hypothetical protein
MKRPRFIAAFIILSALCVACSGITKSDLPTPMPAQFLPTAIALTVQAGANSPVAVSQSEAADPASQPAPSETPVPLPSDTPAPAGPSATPFPVTLQPTPSATPTSEIPVADIQIFKPGDLSRVISPLHVAGYLKTGAGGKVRLELYGEDGRLLVRQIKVYDVLPGARVNLSGDLDFEISAAAEVGRLVISTEDEVGRTIALNSVNLILLSMGEADVNPSNALLEDIVIKQPQVKTLIQGDKLLVSGIALPDTALPLMAELRDAKNEVVGFRQIGVSLPEDGGYGTFASEVPFSVGKLTPVRLSVYESGERISPMTHLSSVEIIISP